MKTIFTFAFVVAYFLNVSAQILERDESWPNPGWSVGGMFETSSLVFNPTIDDKLKFDSTLSLPISPHSEFYAESPIFDLSDVIIGGETILKFEIKISKKTDFEDSLVFQYWDNDNLIWITAPDRILATRSIGDFDTCNNISEGLLLDISNFFPSQLNNFRYRFLMSNLENSVESICVDSPIITSTKLLAPSELGFIDSGDGSAKLNWLGNGLVPNSYFEIEYGLTGFVHGSGNILLSNESSVRAYGLISGSSYDFYVREVYHNVIYTNWAGPYNFTTTSLGVQSRLFNNFKIYPNPTNNLVFIDSEEIVGEIKIFDIDGKQLFEVKPTESKINIDLSSFSSGIYILKVNSDSIIESFKLIKN